MDFSNNKKFSPIDLQSVVSAFTGYVFWKDMELRYRGCNHNAIKLFKLNDPEEIIGKTDHDFNWGKELEEQFFTEDKRVISEQTIITGEYLLPIKGKDNEPIYLNIEKKPLYDSDHKLIGILTVATDITEQKLGDLMGLETLLEYLPCNIYWVNKDFTMGGCNRNVLSMLGMNTLAEFSGKTYEELATFSNWPEGLAHQLKSDDSQVLRTGQSIVSREDPPIPHANGSNLYLLTNRVPIKNKYGETLGVAGISVDISFRKQEESLRIAKAKSELANQAKTEFLENMRHDIRTPLAGIVGCAQLIQMQRGLPEKVVEFANDLALSSEALLDLLNKILESINVSNGKIPILKNKFNLKESLEQIISLNKPQAVVKNLALSLQYDEAIPAYFIGDSVRVQRIILELLTNALKYTDKGSIKVGARLMKNTARKVIIELRVTDTGIGIPHDRHQEIYTRFTRLTPSFKGIYPGAGLGLSIVKQFIEDLKGEIHIESELPHGTSFICLIAFQKSLLMHESHSIESENDVLLDIEAVNEPLDSEDSISNAIKILILENNIKATRYMKNIFSKLDCQTDVAINERIALEKIEKNAYDLILMDMGLLDERGEIIRYIGLKQRQRNSLVSIIGLTTHLENDTTHHFLAHGMNAVFMKPLSLEKASEMLSAFTSTRSLTITSVGKD